ncbi:hypothetical protein CQ052_03880 [Ochrobactrum sp. MYb15]|nr:hypothetical protein CQZ90_05010 [Ochrobactrum sp. MYb19]PRA62817.1 hypothetical protein CQ053_18395 [Ochrobactrum sp. MYb18]PRA76530.1 hypothetical protein CQ049_03880 [Brucella thiophenivorans]PRA93839.1 hypothetical protein CQ051_05010 [Ochrobactrum sp. MYb14]PRA98537.1 hypothetical protein CQ052_03880 [Ochrobactrum sp. MYb15]
MRGSPSNRPFKKSRIGLYAEREFAEGRIFSEEWVVGRHGKRTERSTGPVRVSPVAPRRGASRVGSEGPTANVIAQIVKSFPRTFTNHPGPEIIRSTGVGVICVVTDFIGSGTRIKKMLDLFWKSPSVRSWWRLGWIKFTVVTAAGTRRGIEEVRRHMVNPEVKSEITVPSVADFEAGLVARWNEIMTRYGPSDADGTDRSGYKGSAALVAFTYGLPNNTPIIVHGSGGGWQPLYRGAIPPDSKGAFHPLTEDERAQNAIERAGLELDVSMGIDLAVMLLILSQIRGKWRAGAEEEISERTGLSPSQVRAAITQAQAKTLIASDGHLTEAGQTAIQTIRKPWRRPDIPTEENPYYPWQLRDPRVSFSNRRLTRRPR